MNIHDLTKNLMVLTLTMMATQIYAQPQQTTTTITTTPPVTVTPPPTTSTTQTTVTTPPVVTPTTAPTTAPTTTTTVVTPPPVTTVPVTTTTTTPVIITASDAAITSDIQAKIAQEPTLINTNIIVTSSGGTVTLNGVVTTQSQADMATNIAKAEPGVKAVQSNLTVRAPS